MSGYRRTIWVNFDAQVKVQWVQRTDVYRGFYWSSSAGRWYPSSHGAQTIQKEHGSPNPIISNLRVGSQFVVGELNAYNYGVDASGITQD
jgi:hypothetical protein